MKSLLLILLLVGLMITGCGDDGKSTPTQTLTITSESSPVPTSTGDSNTVTPPATESESNKLPVDTIYAYIEAINAEDLDGMIVCFIEGTYDEKVKQAVLKTFNEGTAQILNPEATLISQSEFLATYEISYDATWQVEGGEVNTSRVKDEVKLVKIEGKWLIQKIKELERVRTIEF